MVDMKFIKTKSKLNEGTIPAGTHVPNGVPTRTFSAGTHVPNGVPVRTFPAGTHVPSGVHARTNPKGHLSLIMSPQGQTRKMSLVSLGTKPKCPSRMSLQGQGQEQVPPKGGSKQVSLTSQGGVQVQGALKLAPL